MRKPSRKGVVKKLDAVVSKFIIQRDKRCVTCGSADQPNNGHLFTRTAYSTRWDVTPDGNCHQQCWPCNFRHEHDPYPFTNWYIGTFGKEKYDALHRRFVTVHKYSTPQLLDLYKEISDSLLTNDTFS
jgi:hypothetical protein